MEQNKQMLELLEKIEKTNRHQLLFTQIFCGLALVAAIFCIITLVQVNRLLPQLEIVVTQMQTVLGDMEQVADQLTQLDMQSIVSNVASLVDDIGNLVGNVEGLVSNVDDLAATAQDSLKQTMTKLNAINFEALNKAIEDLAAVVEPLAKFFNVFS